MKQHVRTLWVIIALVACQPISGAADGTAVVVTRPFATPSLAANQSSQVEVAITASALHTTLPTRTPSSAVTPLIALGETATPRATMTPRPTATGTPTPVATATPTALVLPTPYITIPSDWQTYRNEEYGLIFRYPPAWTVGNPPAWTPFGDSNELPLFLELQRPEASLRIGVKQATAVDTSIVPTGIAAGDLFEGDSVRFFDQDISIIQLIYENQLKSLFYGRIGEEIMVGHLAFFIMLSGDHETRYIEVNLDPAVVNEVVQILATFQFLDQVQ